MSEIIRGEPIPKPDELINKLRELSPGDAHDFPLTTNLRARRNAIYVTARRLEIRVTVRRMPNKFRVWRVA